MAGSEAIYGCPSKSPPAPPSPSQDPGLIPYLSPTSLLAKPAPSPPDDSLAWDADTITPLAALSMLAKVMHGIIDATGDVPPTPTPLRPAVTKPNGGIDAATAAIKSAAHRRTPSRPGTPVPSHDLEAPGFRKLSVGTPEAEADEPPADDYLVAGAGAGGTSAPAGAAATTTPPTSTTEPAGAAAAALQAAVIARKFFSKAPAGVSISAYLARLHRYCPMSAGVYLAAGAYVHQVCVVDRALPATARSAHRLVLAALRVAHKALEDLRYPQHRFAVVGGVAPAELAQLEICLCYLLDFELQAGVPVLQQHWKGLAHAVDVTGLSKKNMVFRLPLRLRIETPW